MTGDDFKLNKALVDIVGGSILGYSIGSLLSIFFKNKQSIRNIGAGFGAGFFYAKNNGQLRFQSVKKCFDDNSNDVKRSAFEEARGVFGNYYGYLGLNNGCNISKQT